MYGHGYDRYTPRTPPVKEGEEIDVRIEAVGEKGDGVAKKDGFVLFVPNVKEGDEVRIRVTKVLRKVGFAEVIGQAQGPVAESAPSKPARSQADVDAREREEIVSQAAAAESTEDFGEDDSGDSDDSEPADDFSEDESQDETDEAPVEETKPAAQEADDFSEDSEETPVEESDDFGEEADDSEPMDDDSEASDDSEDDEEKKE